MLKFFICCEVIRHEAEHVLAQLKSPIEVKYIGKGHHDTPSTLREEVQKAIDAAPPEAEIILLGYGLCGKGLEGVTARGIPLILPRMHDCISLLLGSAKAYAERFLADPGTYYYSPGWIEFWQEEEKGALSQQGYLGLGKTYEDYVEKYGEDNARYLMELEGEWAQRYYRAAYIDMGLEDQGWEQKARAIAAEHNWEFEKIAGSLRLLKLLLAGPWPEDEFVHVPAGAKIIATGDEKILCPEGCK
jgi:hypothetical protein